MPSGLTSMSFWSSFCINTSPASFEKASVESPWKERVQSIASEPAAESGGASDRPVLYSRIGSLGTFAFSARVVGGGGSWPEDEGEPALVRLLLPTVLEEGAAAGCAYRKAWLVKWRVEVGDLLWRCRERSVWVNERARVRERVE